MQIDLNKSAETILVMYANETGYTIPAIIEEWAITVLLPSLLPNGKPPTSTTTMSRATTTVVESTRAPRYRGQPRGADRKPRTRNPRSHGYIHHYKTQRGVYSIGITGVDEHGHEKKVYERHAGTLDEAERKIAIMVTELETGKHGVWSRAAWRKKFNVPKGVFTR